MTSQPIENIGLEPSVLRKLTRDGVLRRTEQLRILRPWVLAKEFRLSDDDYAAIQTALVRAGEPPLDPLLRPAAEAPAPKPKRTCIGVLEERDDGPDVLCGREDLMKGKRTCEWHWLLKQPIAVQIVAADQRRAKVEAHPDFAERARVPAHEWPDGHRWCSECQSMVPLFYVSGSKCKAHASRAAHGSMIQRVYDLSPAEYDSLLAWQRGRCFICQQVPRAKRLAVDHDHVTGEVRGLLCANDEWGCNVTLRRLLNNVDMARRALAYVERWPLSRMRAGEPPVTVGHRRPAPPAVSVAPAAQDDPFAGFLS